MLTACTTRPLSDAEQTFAAGLQGAETASATRLYKVPSLNSVPMRRQARERTTCRERISPPETPGEIVEVPVGGFVLGQAVFVTDPYWLNDYLAGYPEILPLTRAMFLAHELTHVWQWQNRDVTGYSPIAAAREHARVDDPYLFDVTERDFLDYPYEQQASLVEEFVCCRALDPEGDRTARLRAMLDPHFPALAARDAAPHTAIPWAEAQTDGICTTQPG